MVTGQLVRASHILNAQMGVVLDCPGLSPSYS